jgi:hypothetical protein
MKRKYGKRYLHFVLVETLSEAILILEAYDFTFDYLMGHPQWAKVDTFMGWVQERDSTYENETVESNRVNFLQCLRISLCPADIIELSIYSNHWR